MTTANLNCTASMMTIEDLAARWPGDYGFLAIPQRERFSTLHHELRWLRRSDSDGASVFWVTYAVAMCPELAELAQSAWTAVFGCDPMEQRAPVGAVVRSAASRANPDALDILFHTSAAIALRDARQPVTDRPRVPALQASRLPR